MRQLRYCCCLVEIVYWQMKPFITEIDLKLKRVVFIKSNWGEKDVSNVEHDRDVCPHRYFSCVVVYQAACL